MKHKTMSAKYALHIFLPIIKWKSLHNCINQYMARDAIDTINCCCFCWIFSRFIAVRFLWSAALVTNALNNFSCARIQQSRKTVRFNKISNACPPLSDKIDFLSQQIDKVENHYRFHLQKIKKKQNRKKTRIGDYKSVQMALRRIYR